MSLNTFLIALLAGLKIVATFVGGEPVCYSREQIDDLNFKVTRVPCDENKHSLYKTFASHEDVAIVDLVDARCSYEELPKVLNGSFKIGDCTGRRIRDICKVVCNDGYTVTSMKQTTCQDRGNGHAAWSLDNFSCHNFTCSFDELPKVSRGYINMSDCSGNAGNDVCNVTCEEDYYLANRKQTVCKYTGDQNGRWLSVNLSCLAISCPFNKLPTVMNGQFNTTNCTGNLVHDTCDMTCDVNYYTTTIRKTLCQNIGSNEGRWTTDNFTCDAITCPFSDLPSVTNGHFYQSDCSGNSIGDTCPLTCQNNYYTRTPKQTTCLNVGSHQGSWSNDNFFCQAITCSFSDLPSVANGDFHQSDCSGNRVGDTCRLTCQSNYYAKKTNQKTCRNDGSHRGSWSSGKFICESVCPSGWRMYDSLPSYCYKLLTVSSSYDSHETACEDEGGHLASIHSDQENAKIESLCSSGDCFIGLTDQSTEGRWVYSDSTQSRFERWIPGQPDNFKDEEDCVVINSNGYWNDVSCSTLAKGICKRRKRP